jgi:hypothetical protein
MHAGEDPVAEGQRLREALRLAKRDLQEANRALAEHPDIDAFRICRPELAADFFASGGNSGKHPEGGTHAAFDPVRTRKEAGKLLGVTTRTLRNMETRGELQPVYVTSRIVEQPA